jgi:vacuolar protein sorting-associated protein 13A/C
MLCLFVGVWLVQVRPHLGGMSPSLTHNWSQVVPSKARTEMSLRRSATKLFRVRSLTETEELLLCPAEAGSSNTTPGKDIWFCLESKATEIGKNARLEPIQDWCLKISAPLMLDNLLPVPCEYMVSEKSTGRGPIVRDRGIANPGEITFAFHADLRKALYLTWIPQGNWHPKKVSVHSFLLFAIFSLFVSFNSLTLEHV